MIPVVAPPAADSRDSGLERNEMGDREFRLRRIKAPAGGAHNAYNLVMHERATWREAVLGSAFLLGVVTAGGAAAVAVQRWRRSNAR